MRDELMKKILTFLMLGMMLAGIAFAEAPSALDEKLNAIYQNAENATKEGNVSKSDFWLARYMGLTMSAETERSYLDLIPLFEERTDLKPVSFISKTAISSCDPNRFFVVRKILKL